MGTMETESKMSFYGSQFDADREAMAKKIAEDIRNSSDLEKVLFVVGARCQFFGGHNWPEPMRAAFQTYVSRCVFNLDASIPIQTDDPKPSDPEGFNFCIMALAKGWLEIDDIRAKQLIEILNIGATP
jgi:hypothetical protein